jgi:hypothetical protein
MSRPKPRSSATRDPISLPPEPWDGISAWLGSPPRPADPSIDRCSADAAFIGVELECTVTAPKGPELPGMYDMKWEKLAGILRLESGKPVEVHTRGWDGRCWTFRRLRAGRKLLWSRFNGDCFPGTEPAGIGDGGAPRVIEQIMVQSRVPMERGGKHICFVIHDDGRMEDFARAADPDPDDDID